MHSVQNFKTLHIEYQIVHYAKVSIVKMCLLSWVHKLEVPMFCTYHVIDRVSSIIKCKKKYFVCKSVFKKLRWWWSLCLPVYLLNVFQCCAVAARVCLFRSPRSRQLDSMSSLDLEASAAASTATVLLLQMYELCCWHYYPQSLSLLLPLVSNSATHFLQTWSMWPSLLKYQLKTLREGSGFQIRWIFGKVPKGGMGHFQSKNLYCRFWEI